MLPGQRQPLAFDTEAIKAGNPLHGYLEASGIILKRSGGRFVAICPFHEEETPSFVLFENDPQPHAHCYGCGFHGDVIDIDVKLHGGSFTDACERLGGHRATTLRLTSPSAILARQKRQEAEKEKEKLRESARRSRAQILSGYAWTLEEAWNDSPIPHGLVPLPEQWRHFLNWMFDPLATIWIGEFRDSGKPCHRANFHLCEDWCDLDTIPGSRVAAATFKPGTYCRRDEFVADTPYVVIEADEAIGRKPVTPDEIRANRLANLAIIRWVREGIGLDLRAVIDSGNKSLHGWFRHPGESAVADLAAIAPELGIDDLLTKPSQPLRLPGVVHEKSGSPSQIIWLAE